MKRQKTIHHPQYSQLIEELRAERIRLGLSQSDVANALEMTQSEISKIETRERRIDVWELKKLAMYFRIDENPKLKKIVTSFFGLDLT